MRPEPCLGTPIKASRIRESHTEIRITSYSVAFPRLLFLPKAIQTTPRDRLDDGHSPILSGILFGEKCKLGSLKPLR